MAMRVVVEGWRFIPHSFAIVNQFQCLELGARPDVELFHRDAPYWNPAWKPERGLLPDELEKALEKIPAPGDIPADVVLRMGCPFDFSDSKAPRTVVFATCEFGRLTPEVVLDRRSPGEVLATSHAVVITPSNWSKEGLVRSGVPADRIHIVPHGVDTKIFRPATESQRVELRRQLGWHGKFVFLHVGAMRPNKGIPMMLDALAENIDRHPEAILALKGLDSLYQSQQSLQAMMRDVPAAIREKITNRVAFVGTTCSFGKMAALYQAADAYLSPYTGEGFNLPVLEAAACGLPVICTAGGPTDDFTTPEFSRAIRTKKSVWRDGNDVKYLLLSPDREHLVALMSSTIEDHPWRLAARAGGPAHVAARYTWGHTIDKLMPVLVNA